VEGAQSDATERTLRIGGMWVVGEENDCWDTQF